MLTKTRRRLFSEYLSVLKDQLSKHDVSRVRHGWNKTRWIVGIYFTVCSSPHQTLARLRAFSHGSETWENFKSVYAPIVLVTRLEFVAGIFGRLAVPVYLLFFYTPRLAVGDYSKILIASTLWCLLAHVIEHDVYAATTESDIFRFVSKFDRRYNLSKK